MSTETSWRKPATKGTNVRWIGKLTTPDGQFVLVDVCESPDGLRTWASAYVGERS